MDSVRKLFSTDPGNTGALILRVALGLVIFAHGAQKLFGWFGGHGFNATMDFFTTQMNLPGIIVFLVIVTESIGALLLVIGLGSRIMAFGIMCVMIGAITLVHGQHGFFMDWNNNLGGEGFEYHILAVAAALSLMVQGGGRWSFDSLIRFRERVIPAEGEADMRQTGKKEDKAGKILVKS